MQLIRSIINVIASHKIPTSDCKFSHWNLHYRIYKSNSSTKIFNSIIQIYSLSTCSINLFENSPGLQTPFIWLSINHKPKKFCLNSNYFFTNAIVFLIYFCFLKHWNKIIYFLKLIFKAKNFFGKWRHVPEALKNFPQLSLKLKAFQSKNVSFRLKGSVFKSWAAEKLKLW